MSTSIFMREIKSFVKRQRKLSTKQQKAYDAGCQKYLLALPDQHFDLDKIFNRKAPKILEIGFGDGDNLWQDAKKNPDFDYIGIEVHEPGVAELMFQLLENNVKNVRVIQSDAVKIIRNLIPNHTFSRIHIFFPDPWRKKRHHKRRLIQANFVEMLRQKLCDDGVIHCATDWENYAEHMMSVLSAAEGFKNAMGENQFADNEKMKLRVNTRFEMRGVKLGHGVWDLLFIKT